MVGLRDGKEKYEGRQIGFSPLPGHITEKLMKACAYFRVTVAPAAKCGHICFVVRKAKKLPDYNAITG